MSPYILHCTVCEHDFTTRTKWLHHLLESEHQKKARDQFSHWDDTVKECTLVVFSSFPVAKCDSILKHFSSNRRMEEEGFVENYDKFAIVTDFVWFPERPFVGFLQFESSAKLDALVPSSRSLDVHIDNQLVQVKKAADFMQLEWNLLRPMKNEASHPEPNMEKKELVGNGYNNSSPPNPVMPEPDSGDTPSEQFADTQIPQEENNDTRKDCRLETIHIQFESIQGEMTILDPFYKLVHLATRKLETVFSDQFPNVRAILFRNHYLSMSNGIQHSGNDEVLIFLQMKSEYSTGGTEVNWLTEDTLQINIFIDVFNTPKARSLFGGRVVATDEEIPGAYTFVSNIPELKFNVITDSRFLPESQASRLLMYMMTFDSRVKPLLILVRFWAKINGVRLSHKSKKSFEPPESFHLDWLLIFFLCNKKILPTPRQIQQNPHDPLLLDGVDVGFSEESRYPADWRSQNPVAHAKENLSTCPSDILPLLLDFFRFLHTQVFGSADFKKVIINCRDADKIKKKDIFPDSRILQPIACLTKDEVRIVRSHRRMNVVLGHNLFMLHPLYLGSLCDLDMGRHLWTCNRRIIIETRKQLETSCRKCDVSGEMELIGDSHFRKFMRVKLR